MQVLACVVSVLRIEGAPGVTSRAVFETSPSLQLPISLCRALSYNCHDIISDLKGLGVTGLCSGLHRIWYNRLLEFRSNLGAKIGPRSTACEIEGSKSEAIVFRQAPVIRE